MTNIFGIKEKSSDELNDISIVGGSIKRIQVLFEELMEKGEDNYELVELQEVDETVTENICKFREYIFLIINRF